MITVEGKKYKVTEDLKYQISIGEYAKEVMTEDGPRIVVGGRGNWRFWTAEDRVLPIKSAMKVFKRLEVTDSNGGSKGTWG